jgi:hypothetical protein
MAAARHLFPPAESHAEAQGSQSKHDPVCLSALPAPPRELSFLASRTAGKFDRNLVNLQMGRKIASNLILHD